MPAKDGYMTNEYKGGDQQETSCLESAMHIIFFPFYLIGRLFGISD